MYLKIKRIIDIALVLITAPVSFPVMGLLALIIKATSPGPVFFRQRRAGRDRADFQIFKFRTMRVDTPKDMPTHLLENPEKYITGIGNIMRKTSLDELPQLFNILRGEMSIIGPRPALWNQFDLLAERDKYGANALLPGLTGWAQINGRDELPIPVKAKYDGEYAEKVSFIFDCKIFFLTIAKVFRGSGVKEGKA